MENVAKHVPFPFRVLDFGFDFAYFRPYMRKYLSLTLKCIHFVNTLKISWFYSRSVHLTKYAMKSMYKSIWFEIEQRIWFVQTKHQVNVRKLYWAPIHYYLQNYLLICDYKLLKNVCTSKYRFSSTYDLVLTIISYKVLFIERTNVSYSFGWSKLT